MSSRRPPAWSALAVALSTQRRRYLLLGCLVVVQTGLTVAGPLVLRHLVDRAGTATPGRLTVLGGWYLGLALAAQTVLIAVTWLATDAAWRAANVLRLHLTGHVLGLGHAFHRNHSPGALIQRVDGDVTAVSDFLSRAVVKVASGVLQVVAVVVALTVIDPRLGLGMAAYALVAGLVAVGQRHRSVDESAGALRTAAALHGGIEDRLAASEDLRANGAGPWALWRFVGDTTAHIAAVRHRERSSAGVWRRVNAAVVAGVVLALVAGSAAVNGGWMTVGTAFLLVQYVQQLRRPLEELTQELAVIQKALGALTRMAELLDTAPTIVDRGRRSPPPGPLSIRFDRVGFHYGDGSGVLHEVDLEIAAGRSVGLVGHTGSGKTTLSRLLLRLVEATSGTLSLSGVPIADIPLSELRRRVALIPQTVDLIAGSVRDNVTLYADEVADAEVDRALALVGLDRLRGPTLHAPLGPDGIGLSAGESQLLALARAWIRPFDLVVLDEPTARVDPDTEARLEHAIADLVRQRSVVVIAHRLSTLHRMDEIVVLEGGRVIEHGPRDQLEADVASRFRELLTAGGLTPPDPAGALPVAEVGS